MVWRLEGVVGLWCLKAVSWRSGLGSDGEGKWGMDRSLELGCRQHSPLPTPPPANPQETAHLLAKAWEL